MTETIAEKHQVIQIRCAAAFFIMAVFSLLLAVIVKPLGKLLTLPANQIDSDFSAWAIAIAMISAILGFILNRSATAPEKSAREVLPEEADKYLGPALAKSLDPIGDWTKLAGLTGGTGVFRKLDLSGMPLATILMTFVFCLLSVMTPWAMDFTISPSGAKNLATTLAGLVGKMSESFLDMAKLTLGAFIGSFVTAGSARASEAVKAGAVAALTANAAGGGGGGNSGPQGPIASSPIGPVSPVTPAPNAQKPESNPAAQREADGAVDADLKKDDGTDPQQTG